MGHVVILPAIRPLAAIYLTGAIGGSRAVDALPIGSTPRDRDKTSCAVERDAFRPMVPYARGYGLLRFARNDSNVQSSA